MRLGAYLARKEVILAEQQVVVIIVECYRHAVIGEHQEGQGAGTDLAVWDQVAHQRLKERLPSGIQVLAEKPF